MNSNTGSREQPACRWQNFIYFSSFLKKYFKLRNRKKIASHIDFNKCVEFMFHYGTISPMMNENLCVLLMRK